MIKLTGTLMHAKPLIFNASILKFQSVKMSSEDVGQLPVGIIKMVGLFTTQKNAIFVSFTPTSFYGSWSLDSWS